MAQPKFSVKNKELLNRYSEALEIPDEESSSKVIVAVIGDEFTSKSGQYQMVPVMFIQNRSDIKTAEVDTSEADKYFRGWTGFNTLLRHIENVDIDIFNDLDFSEGDVLKDANLCVDYSLDEFRPGQEPLMNPQTEELVTSDGDPIYRQTRVTFGPAAHTGLNIPRDKVEVEKTEVTVPVDEEDDF